MAQIEFVFERQILEYISNIGVENIIKIGFILDLPDPFTSDENRKYYIITNITKRGYIIIRQLKITKYRYGNIYINSQIDENIEEEKFKITDFVEYPNIYIKSLYSRKRKNGRYSFINIHDVLYPWKYQLKNLII